MRDYRYLSFCVAPGLYHGVLDVQPLNPFDLDVYARQPYHVGVTVCAAVLLTAPCFVSVFAAQSGKFQLAAFTFRPAVHSLLSSSFPLGFLLKLLKRKGPCARIADVNAVEVVIFFAIVYRPAAVFAPHRHVRR
jgi:hypothetical protein